ncbi:hypothetical protein D9613_005629 [Agrocybe pediades]|uniref:Uncharacterized protein n=1 Tax=Agrocybe pediades TaxID=84607 RepID=A0A8H4QTJ9_9AGAR|nr:hypothetical protein D9613_005629 [Agrocybe pediades]
MSLLVHYRDNLQSVSIQHWHCYDSPFGIEAILEGITLVTPDLKYLQIFNYGDYTVTGISHLSIWNPINSGNLETLALRFRRLPFPHLIDDMEKGYARLSTPSGRLEAVQHISSSLLGLKRFVLIEDGAEVYTRNEEGILELDPSAPPWDDKEWERVGMDLDEA